MATKNYKLSNNNGLEIEFLSLGAKIKSILIPKGDTKVDIALGYDTIEEYETGDTYVGAICGRYANRIAMGQFNLHGKTYQLAQNDRTNHLHGGLKGFNALQWKVEAIKLADYASAYKLELESPDGHENYPGNLKVQLVYALNNENELLIDLHAISDKDTIINLTSHPYFNLNGVGSGKIFNHELKIVADAFTPLNDISVPTGEICTVKGTDMDFNTPIKLSERINSDYEQIKKLGGLDHNWVLNKKENELALAGVLSETESGRSIEVYTTQPGLQVYTAMHFDGSQKGKNQIPFTPYCAIALEAQNFPDAPNKANFPNTILKAEELYSQKIIYRFGF
jgi:aldose 1-epimerase